MGRGPSSTVWPVLDLAERGAAGSGPGNPGSNVCVVDAVLQLRDRALRAAEDAGQAHMVDVEAARVREWLRLPSGAILPVHETWALLMSESYSPDSPRPMLLALHTPREASPEQYDGSHTALFLS